LKKFEYDRIMDFLDESAAREQKLVQLKGKTADKLVHLSAATAFNTTAKWMIKEFFLNQEG
jgi:hypothetical protein